MIRPVTDILMYHSVSGRGGATAIAPEVFAAQMRAVAEAGVPVVTLDDILAHREGKAALPPRSVAISFDDGFRDFADAAWPEMERLGFRPIVYLPTGFVGRAEGWKGIADPPRPLMDWATIRALHGAGVLFGSHTVSHPDLAALPPDALELELTVARDTIADRLGAPVPHFAPPYGRAPRAVRARIAATYRTSVGTRLGPARDGDDIHDLPRIEMFYFTDIGLWRRHLSGQGAAYLTLRRTMRTARGLVLRPWTGAT